MNPTSGPRPQPDSLVIGQVAAPFGIKGELKVNILTEFPDRFNKLEAVILAPDADLAGQAPLPPTAPNPQPTPVPAPGPEPHLDSGQALALPPRFRPPKQPTLFRIEAVRGHKGQALLKLEGIDDANSAEALRNYWILIPIEQAHKLPRGAFYLYQIVGLEVFTTAGEFIGKIDEVLTTAANDVYVVRGPGVTDPTGELLVPAVKAIVKEMKPETGRIVIAPPAEWS